LAYDIFDTINTVTGSNAPDTVNILSYTHSSIYINWTSVSSEGVGVIEGYRISVLLSHTASIDVSADVSFLFLVLILYLWNVSKSRYLNAEAANATNLLLMKICRFVKNIIFNVKEKDCSNIMYLYFTILYIYTLLYSVS